MASDGQPIERLRDYLRALKPPARAMLLAELERSLLRGEESAGNELILQELRQVIRGASQPVPRIGDAARLFFAPLEPFLIDGPADHKRASRIARVSLEPIWGWIYDRTLIASDNNPDKLSLDALCAELSNHLIPDIVLTPGAVGTLVEMEKVGFAYAR